MTLLEHPQLLRLAATLLLDIPRQRRIEVVDDLAGYGVPLDSAAAAHLADLVRVAPEGLDASHDTLTRTGLALGLRQLADGAQSKTGHWCQPSGEPSAEEVTAVGESIEQGEGVRRPC